jgi:hypothetical protein
MFNKKIACQDLVNSRAIHASTCRELRSGTAK